MGQDESRLMEKAKTVSDLSKVTEHRSVIFIERVRTRDHIEGTALIGRDELRKLEETERLCDLVAKRSEPNAKR
jgi:predicted transcriptional regulator